MKFQIDFNFNSAEKISCRNSVFLIGSCFAENIGEKFIQSRFHCTVNPSGILFNPASVSFTLRKIIRNEKYSEADLLHHNNLYHCLNHHGSFSGTGETDVLKKINEEVECAHAAIQKNGWLIITFGSAYAWKHKKSGTIAANCHKIPSSEFEKIFISPSEIFEDWSTLLSELNSFNPNLKVMFTVSPVRYIRDGLTENNRSKASLFTAVHDLCLKFGSVYFPAYEIVNDILRDYRFFTEDMVHPSKQAINFVWEKFCEGMMDAETQKVIEEVDKYNAFKLHRPIHSPDAAAHLKKSAEQEKALSEKYDFLYWQ